MYHVENENDKHKKLNHFYSVLFDRLYCLSRYKLILINSNRAAVENPVSRTYPSSFKSCSFLILIGGVRACTLISGMNSLFTFIGDSSLS